MTGGDELMLGQVGVRRLRAGRAGRDERAGGEQGNEREVASAGSTPPPYHAAEYGSRTRRCRAMVQPRSSSATHSMCGVCGNMSTGTTRRSS